MHFVFGDHVLDPARRELRRGAELIEVEPQVFDLLLHLMSNLKFARRTRRTDRC